MSRRQHDAAREWKDRIHALDERAAVWRDTLDPERLARRPADGGWSPGQVFEHLIISLDLYLGPMERLIAEARHAADKARDAVWKPSVMGNLLYRSLASPRRMPTAGKLKVGPEFRPTPVQEFLVRHRQLDELLDRAADVVWKDIRLVSPVTSLVRMNLGDGFAVNVVHAERHFGQIERRVDG